MSDSRPERDVYAPPQSRLGVEEKRGPLRMRFRATCLVCAIGIVTLSFAPFEWSVLPGWSLTALAVVAFWLAPALWILLPDLRRLGLKDAVLLRFVEVSVKYALTTALFWGLIVVPLLLGYTVFALIRDPSLLKLLSSPG